MGSYRGRFPSLFMLSASVLAVGLLAGPVQADEVEAEVAIERTAAVIDVMKRRNIAIASEPAFVRAEEILRQARRSDLDGNTEDAAWRAREAEILAELAAETQELKRLEAERDAARRSMSGLRRDF